MKYVECDWNPCTLTALWQVQFVFSPRWDSDADTLVYNSPVLLCGIHGDYATVDNPQVRLFIVNLAQHNLHIKDPFELFAITINLQDCSDGYIVTGDKVRKKIPASRYKGESG